MRPAPQLNSVASITVALIALALALSGEFERLAIMANLAVLLVYLGCAAAAWKLRRMGVRVLISDLLWPGNPVQTIRRFREGAAALFVIQLLGRDDVTPPEHGSIRLVDSESGEVTEIFVDATVKKQYRDNLAQLQQSWDDACRQNGAHLTTLVAEDLETSLNELEAIQLLIPA